MHNTLSHAKTFTPEVAHRLPFQGDMSDLKALMRAAQTERTGSVQHPAAKYNSVGKLACKLCGVVVGADSLWPAHLRSAAHMQVRRVVAAGLPPLPVMLCIFQIVDSLKRQASASTPAARFVLCEYAVFEKSSVLLAWFLIVSPPCRPTAPPAKPLVAATKPTSSLPAGFFDDDAPAPAAAVTKPAPAAPRPTPTIPQAPMQTPSASTPVSVVVCISATLLLGLLACLCHDAQSCIKPSGISSSRL
jgi:hypothetical protein